MVTVIDFKLCQNKQGKVFYALIVQGGIQMVTSASGQLYATAKKASIPTSFDEATCKNLIGQELSGSIQKVQCEPYQVTKKDTGEQILLNSRYVYVTEQDNSRANAKIVQTNDFPKPSTNGKHEGDLVFAN